MHPDLYRGPEERCSSLQGGMQCMHCTHTEVALARAATGPIMSSEGASAAPADDGSLCGFASVEAILEKFVPAAERSEVLRVLHGANCGKPVAAVDVPEGAAKMVRGGSGHAARAPPPALPSVPGCSDSARKRPVTRLWGDDVLGYVAGEQRVLDDCMRARACVCVCARDVPVLHCVPWAVHVARVAHRRAPDVTANCRLCFFRLD